MSRNLAKLEQELQMMAEGEEVAKEEEVVAGSVWECLGCPPAVVVQGRGSRTQTFRTLSGLVGG